MGNKYHFINGDIVIDFEDLFDQDYIDLLREAEQWDLENNYGMFANCSKSIEVGAKYLCEAGRISSRQWHLLEMRYGG